MDGRIFRLTNQVSENLDHNWTIQGMADSLGLSAPHFRRLFKESVGSSPGEYLRTLRLAEAKLLLETTFDQIGQIGLSVGLPDIQHFGREFKYKYGLSPSEYRKRHWAAEQEAMAVLTE